MSLRVGVDGRVVHGLDGHARLVVASAVGRVHDHVEDLDLARAQFEVGIDAVVADVLVVDLRRLPLRPAEPGILDLEAGRDEVGQHQVFMPVEGQVLDPDFGHDVETLPDLIDGHGIPFQVSVGDLDRQPFGRDRLDPGRGDTPAVDVDVERPRFGIRHLDRPALRREAGVFAPVERRLRRDLDRLLAVPGKAIAERLDLGTAVVGRHGHQAPRGLLGGQPPVGGQRLRNVQHEVLDLRRPARLNGGPDGQALVAELRAERVAVVAVGLEIGLGALGQVGRRVGLPRHLEGRGQHQSRPGREARRSRGAGSWPRGPDRGPGPARTAGRPG
ncbi:MAG: hypothetical protein MZV64_12840 [Ignavibacteriales bacterium]|nr:hypothetical protein [Ignavibacteriales bacterium]